eukprot:8194804-Pyramimonas_sp.AAC.1
MSARVEAKAAALARTRAHKRATSGGCGGAIRSTRMLQAHALPTANCSSMCPHTASSTWGGGEGARGT